MKTNLFKRKGRIAFLGVLVCLLGASENAWAGHGGPHYFDGTAIVSSNGTGSGKVYVGGPGSTIESITEDQWKSESYTSEGLNCGDTDGNDYINFFAQPADDSYLEGWYSEDACTSKQSSDVTYKFSTQSGTTTRYAKFMQKFSLYYAATAEVNKGGSVKIAFAEGDVDSGTNPVNSATEPAGVSSASVTAYFKAFPLEGYTFVGWKETPVGEIVSEDLTWSKSFEANSSSEASPTTLTVYAYFEKESEYQAEVKNDLGEVAYQGSLSGAISYAPNGSTVRLLRSFALAAPQTISKKITLDFNNYTISGDMSNLIVISANVAFADNSAKGNGGVRVTKEAASDVCAVNISSGSLTHYNGQLIASNESAEEGAKAVGVSVASGATLTLNGGTIKAVGTKAAEGVQVANGAAADLTTGTIDVQAADNALGVLANGTVKISWSVAINATTTATNAIGVVVDNADANVTINGGVITATAGTTNAYAVQVKQSTVNVGGNMAAKASAGTASSAYALKQEGSAVVNVETGRFYTANTQDMTAETPANLKLYGGYYTKDVPAAYIQKGVTKGDLQSGTKFYTEGYRYVLTNGDNPNYVVATANGKKFSSLEDAITYANNNPSTAMTIRLEVSEYTLPAGNYTIPEKASLLIPYQSTETSVTSNPASTYAEVVTPSPFCKLTLASGVQMDVYGKVQMGGMRSAKGQLNSNNGTPTQTYGWMHMNAGSRIVLANGSHFYAWGFVTGSGEIDARRGSTVYEFIQIKDWKGGTCTSGMPKGKAFPFNQYYVQNIECPVTYHPGAAEKCAGCVNVWSSDVSFTANFIGIDGSGSLFMMNEADDSEDTWVRKRYDAAHDSLIFEVNNSAILGSLSLYGYSSADYVLPITNNMRFHVLNGSLEITENVEILPGAEIEVDKKAKVTLKEGKSLYIFDADDWMIQSYSGNTTANTCVVPYFPTWAGSGKTCPRNKVVTEDASINVHGTLEINGSLYTTAGGANIHSHKEDAGTVIFNTTAPAEATSVYVNNTTNKSSNTAKTANPAWLINEDGTHVETAGGSGSYCFLDIDGTGAKWTQLEEDEDNSCVVVDKADPEHPRYFAKPQAYVELSSNVEDPTYHVYFSKDFTRTFILIGDCEWWEVEPVEENDALAHCTHPDNNKYYYYDDSDPNPAFHEWKEKRFTVTWVTRPYEELEENQGRVVYNVDYKSTPKYNGTTPSRPMTDYYTYDFTGWLPDIVPVTDDAVYVAQFQQNDRKYLITFLDEDGSVLEEALWKMGEVPAPVNEPTPSGKKLVWEPTIQAVTGEATYRATYTDIVLPAYQITFKNWDGTLLQQGDVETNTIPEYTGETPTKPSLADVAFEFEGWTPDLAPVDGEAIYIAKFREKPATYTITFKRAVGNEGVAIEPAETIQELELGYGETPVCTSDLLPTKTSTAAEYYTLVWSPLITAVTGNATYTATGFAAHKNTCRLTVSAGANGKVALDGSEEVLSAIYEYGDEATITATATTTGYSFKRWSDGNTQNPRTVTVNAAISLTAEFAINQYEIIWKKDADTEIERTMVNHGVVPTHVAPTKATDESYTYTFAGWSPTPVAATTNTIYTATFNPTPIEYTIRIVLNNGMSDIVYEGMHYNDEVAIGTPIKASKNGVDYTFSHWTNSADENIGATIPNVTRNEIYYAQYDTHINDLIAGNSDEANAKDLSLTESGLEASSLVIEASGTVNITSDATVTVQNLILESNGSQSGQLIGTSSARLTVNEHAYFDLTLNAQRRTWYAVAVPWAVNAETGISIKGGRRLVLGRDFDLIYYQGNVRASEGPGYQCWKYAEDGDGDKIMHPGRAYMMYFGSEFETIRFENYDDTPFDDAVLTVSQYSASNTDDANWNGIANPRAYHATMGAGGATYGYYLNNGKVDEYNAGEGEPTYKLVNLAAFNAIVGKPLFIQAVNTNSITTTPKIAAAPRRIREIEIEEGVETVYEVTFGAEGSANRDNIFIQTVETKEDGYVLGQDLVKAGYNAKLPQMWINRFGKKLSVNTATPVDGVHEYPLVINIPQAGEYTIAIESTQGDTEALYLTKDGMIIWNLSNGAYIGSFEKGQETAYALRTAAKAPMMPTGIDEAIVNAQGEIKKVVIEDKVFIIRGNNVYSVHGQLVK